MLRRLGPKLITSLSQARPQLQADLPRLLQERSFYRVGGEEVRVDAWVIATTNKDLRDLVRAGRFHHDLYYRLNVIELHLPPLRQRRTDIPLLAQHFVERIALEMGKPITGIREDALELLIDYD
jgi:DNA-binding NtrC family response regulator